MFYGCVNFELNCLVVVGVVGVLWLLTCRLHKPHFEAACDVAPVVPLVFPV